jgi:hypothetical protein
MLSSIFSHARHNLVAYLALFVALGGTSYAAINLPAKSVGAKQLRSGAVRSPAVKDRSLLARDFKAGQLRAGSQGIPGTSGARGSDGSTGANGSDGANGATNVTMRWASSGGLQTGQANCLPGESATGGGYGISSSSSQRFSSSTPAPNVVDGHPTGWTVIATNPGTEFFSIYVVCAAP